MKNLKELRAMLASTLFNFKEQELPNGDVLLYDGEDLVEGMEVKVSAPNGEPVPAEGTYTVDNKEIVIEGGIVKTITEIKKEEEAPVELEEVEEVIEDKVEDKQDFSEVLAMIEMLTKRVAELETALAGTTETVTKLSKVEMAEPIKKNPIQLEKTEKGAQTAMKYFQ